MNKREKMGLTDINLMAYLLARKSANFNINDFQYKFNCVKFNITDVCNDAIQEYYDKEEFNVNIRKFLHWKNVLIDIVKEVNRTSKRGE